MAMPQATLRDQQYAAAQRAAQMRMRQRAGAAGPSASSFGMQRQSQSGPRSVLEGILAAQGRWDRSRQASRDIERMAPLDAAINGVDMRWGRQAPPSQLRDNVVTLGPGNRVAHPMTPLYFGAPAAPAAPTVSDPERASRTLQYANARIAQLLQGRKPISGVTVNVDENGMPTGFNAAGSGWAKARQVPPREGNGAQAAVAGVAGQAAPMQSPFLQAFGLRLNPNLSAPEYNARLKAMMNSVMGGGRRVGGWQRVPLYGGGQVSTVPLEMMRQGVAMIGLDQHGRLQAQMAGDANATQERLARVNAAGALDVANVNAGAQRAIAEMNVGAQRDIAGMNVGAQRDIAGMSRELAREDNALRRDAMERAAMSGIMGDAQGMLGVLPENMRGNAALALLESRISKDPTAGLAALRNALGAKNKAEAAPRIPGPAGGNELSFVAEAGSPEVAWANGLRARMPRQTLISAIKQMYPDWNPPGLGITETVDPYTGMTQDAPWFAGLKGWANPVGAISESLGGPGNPIDAWQRFQKWRGATP